jgi:malonyl-CoA O-methyltransferase
VKPDFHRRSVAARFSASAPTYDHTSKVQLAVALKLMPFLANVERPVRILEIGCGTGLFTQLIADRFPDAGIEAIDNARDLAKIARRRFAGNDKVVFHIADALTFQPRNPAQLIVSASTFHWIVPLGNLLRNVAGMLSGDGRLVFSMMLRGTLIELHESRRRVAREKPVLSVLPCAEQVLEDLDAAGLVVTDKQEEAIQVDYPSATDFLYSLHNLGVTGGGISSSGTPLTRLQLAELLADYAQSYPAENGGVFATYRILYTVAVPRRKA